MKSRYWRTGHITKSRVIPEAYYAAVYPEFDINSPNQTFSGFTYAIDIEAEHQGWDHFVGILYKDELFPDPFAGLEEKEMMTSARIKRGVVEGTYQFMLNLYTLFDINSSQETIFEHPIDTLINFYIQPYLIEPSSQRIYYLWDRRKTPHGSKGFPVGMPGAINREELPFIED